MKRPFGVTVIAIFALISGLMGLCWPILVFTGSGFLESIPFLGSILSSIGVIAGIFLLVGPVLQLFFAVGALNLQSWAWYLGLISTGITVLGVVISLFEGSSLWSAIWSGLVPIIIFFYLLSPNVHQAFGQTPQQPASAVAAAPVEPPAQDNNRPQ